MNMKTTLHTLSLILAGSQWLAAADIVTGDITSALGPDFFFDSASPGGGTDFNSNNPSFNRSFGTLNNGTGGAEITITGIGWASSAGGTTATSVTVTITYLGADQAVGGGDDILVGSVTDNLVFTAAGEYVWDFDTPLVAQIDGLGNWFQIAVSANGNIRYKTFPNTSGVDNVKLSVAGTSTPLFLPDADSDGLPDIYETNTGVYISPTDTGSDPNDADTDGDNLLDGEEVLEFGTNPNLADTDGDTINDDVEIANGTDPTLIDTDGDGLADNVETNTGIYVDETDTGTDPLLADTDGDGLADGVETNTKVFVGPGDTGTDPNNNDSDGDDLSDGWEVLNGTNPHVMDADGDPDLDGLDNLAERNAGTNPLDPDSDNDGLSDGTEANPLLPDYTGTSPIYRDSDGDSLSDKFEVDNGLNPLADADYDNDGFSDRLEVLFYGSDPKLDTSFPGDGVHPAPGSFTAIQDAGSVSQFSQLDTAGNLGSTVINEVALGGFDFTFGSGVTNFTLVYPDALPAANSSVTLTGFAWVVPNAGTANGDIRVDFYDPGADGVFDGLDADTHLGTAIGTLTTTGSTTVMYWNFDTPITFTSSGTALAVRIQSTASLRIKAQDNIATGYWHTNTGSGIIGDVRASKFSIGGTAIAPDGPRILTITRDGTSTTLTWDPGSAAAVDLERSTDLGINNPRTKVLTGTTETFYNETSSDPAAFFRLVVPASGSGVSE
jgi:hypothetical protein